MKNGDVYSSLQLGSAAMSAELIRTKGKAKMVCLLAGGDDSGEGNQAAPTDVVLWSIPRVDGGREIATGKKALDLVEN